MPVPECGCQIWLGAVTTFGHGQIRFMGILFYVHRLVWEAEHGSLPPDVDVLHHCDTPACIRLDHLFLGDQQSNMADMVAKKRQHFIVTKEMAIAIRTSPLSQRKAGIKFGVNKGTIANVRAGRYCKHLEE